jgi:hypothetical protein
MSAATAPADWYFPSYGMGAESSAWLHRILAHPKTRPARRVWSGRHERGRLDSLEREVENRTPRAITKTSP